MTDNTADVSSCEKATACSIFSNKVFQLLFIISLFNYIDRQILYAVFPLIKADLGVTDTKLGMLGSAFMIAYMLYSPVAGYYGDRKSRPFWIGISAVFWSIFTMLGGIAKTYWQLLFARGSVGVGEGGYMTISPSFLAEHFPLEKRAGVMAAFNMATPVGSAIGYVLGGYLGQSFGWRNAFFIVGVPGLILGILAMRLEDVHHGVRKAASFPKLKEYTQLFRSRTYLYTAFAVAAATFTLGGLAAWMPSYFNRYFNMSPGKAGMVFGGITVVSGLIGTLFGGWLSDKLLARTKKAYFLVSGLAFLIGVPIGLACLYAPSEGAALALLFVAEIFLFMYSGPLNAAVLNSSPSNMQSMGVAVYLFIIHAFGDAVSPTIIGAMSDMWGLKTGVACCVMVILLAALFCQRAAANMEQ